MRLETYTSGNFVIVKVVSRPTVVNLEALITLTGGNLIL